ncbi:hypothetical protein Tco_1057414 [Tanacetum coccineum]|uniref:Zf-CCHC domain-containing protein/DUF4219 domain-containing protein/UBN2 domain-containing protein n=1 Tax=Tanacetum coccineum TaxID=301880 RepID=A0ABQ5H5B2_9ASTR
MNGDFPQVAKNEVTDVLEVVPFEEQTGKLKKKLAKNNESKMVIYNALPKKEYERIFMCKAAKDIWQSLLITHQALDEGFSSKNYVRKFFRALHPKWRAKVTMIEESKDLSSLALDELISNLKSSDDETLTSRSDDEEYAMVVRNFKKCGDLNHLIDECPKPPRNKDQKAFVGGSWNDSKNEAEDKINDETCLMPQSSNEVTLDSSHYSDNASSFIADSLGFDKSKASTSGTKPMSFVGSIVELAGDESSIKAYRSTIPGFPDPSTGQKQTEHVFSPLMSS